jgi:hypothetical protein
VRRLIRPRRCAAADHRALPGVLPAGHR